MATTTQFDRLLNNARIHLPGVLDDVLKLELFEVLREFFQVTSVWKEEITFETRANQTNYEITPTNSSAIDKLISVVDANGVPVNATMQDPDTLILGYEPPNDDDELTVTVALTIDEPAFSDDLPAGVPEWITKKYHSALLQGLLGRIMSQPAKPYSNERMSVFHLRNFRNLMVSARADAMHQNLYGGQRWRFPQAFAV